MAPRDVEELKDDYFFKASDYYVTGRFAYLTWATDVCGNLFHHSIEMFLKGQLLLTMTKKDVRALDHSLPRIWRVFKTKVPDPRLKPYNRTIENIHAFESMRYPDSNTARGMLIHWEVTRASLDTLKPGGDKTRGLPKYVIALEEIDRLVLLLLELCSRNPKVCLRGRLPREERQHMLETANDPWQKYLRDHPE